MKLFKVSPTDSTKTQFVFAKDVSEAMLSVPPILRGNGVAIEELCGADEISPANNRPMALFFGTEKDKVMPFHRAQLYHHLNVEMSQLEQVNQTIQKEKVAILVRLFTGVGFMGLAKMIKERGLPNSIYTKVWDLDRLSFLNVIAPVSCRMQELFDKDNNVLMYWEGDQDYHKRIIHITL